MIDVKKPSQVPRGRHYAIIVYQTTNVFIEGDERSLTNPGHGYPAHTETFHSFQHLVTQSRQEWEDNVKHREELGQKDYVAFIVTDVAKITMKVEIGICD